jgi:hypothetical protein
MAKGAKPFKYRGKWRAQVTLDNGMRPAKDLSLTAMPSDGYPSR